MDLRFVRIAQEGLGTIYFSAALCFLFALLGFFFLFFVFLLLTAFIVFFFRDPKRELPLLEHGSVICPADGRIIDISEVFEESHLCRKTRRVSIFLSIFDCHINRFPVSGKVVGTFYRPGEFRMAFEGNSSESNERLSTLVECESGVRVVIVQVAGFLARRIVSHAKFGDVLEIGEKFGMIKFGSRVDVYLPEDARVGVSVGQKVVGGRTVIAWLT
ncbi:MAG: phosphatidylserine decarboxylase family protein [Candidatus Dadabacteria bacterium]|nr:phosphatidylserine decarboxylase family protein [Candidatus Dadabacteria bacterium]